VEKDGELVGAPFVFDIWWISLFLEQDRSWDWTTLTYERFVVRLARPRSCGPRRSWRMVGRAAVHEQAAAVRRGRSIHAVPQQV
jgi:hypothetical protein